MKKMMIVFILVLLALLLASCRSAEQPTAVLESPMPTKMLETPAPTETKTPLPDEVINTIWEWRELNVTDPESKYTIKDPIHYTVFFNQDGYTDVEADCNFIQGEYELSGQSLDFSVGAPRYTICAPESDSCTYLILLGQVDSYRLEEGKLILPFGDGAGELVFYSVGAMDIPPSDISGGEGPSVEGPGQEPPGEEGPGEEGPGEDTSKKAIVCHKVEGKNPVTLEISKKALQAHLDHGDVEGACP